MRRQLHLLKRQPIACLDTSVGGLQGMWAVLEVDTKDTRITSTVLWCLYGEL